MSSIGRWHEHRPFQARVYYEDTDFSGNVYHAAYLHFFERARTEFLRERGAHHSELVKDGIAFACGQMSIDFKAAGAYRRPARCGHRGRLAGPRRGSTWSSRSRRDGVEITRAEVQVVAIKTSGGVARLPRGLVDLLKP